MLMRPQIARTHFLAERLFVVGALLYFMGAIIPVLRDPDHARSEVQNSDSFSLLLQLLIYAGAVFFMFPNRGRFLRVFAKNPVLCSLLLLILVSCVWSPVPLFTLRRAIVFMLTTGFGLYLGTRFEAEEQIRFVAYALAFCVIAGVVFIVALPRFGCDPMYHDAWRGVFGHKNGLGTYMTIAAVTFLCFPVERFYERLARYVLLALSLILLIGSQSKGAYAVIPVLISLIYLYRLLHLDWKRLIPAAAVALTVLAIAVIFVASNTDAILQALGKNATLTGRIPLWMTVLGLSSDNRLLGYGFVGFWATQSHTVWSMVGWMPHKAHNAFIDILLGLGFVGLAIFLMNTGVAAWRSMKLIARERTLESQWPLLMLSVLLLFGVFEIDLMSPNSFVWVAYITVTVSTQRAWSLSRSAVPALAPDTSQLSSPGCEPCPQ